MQLTLALRVAEQRKKGLTVMKMVVKVAHFLADFLVLKIFILLLGIDRCRWLSPPNCSNNFPTTNRLVLGSLGKPMYEVYGQTECTGIATANTSKDNRVGSVGRATNGTEVVLSSEEILIQKDQELIRDIGINLKKTAETFVTGLGDVEPGDEDRYITIVDRMKDIIITAGRENIYAKQR